MCHWLGLGIFSNSATDIIPTGWEDETEQGAATTLNSKPINSPRPRLIIDKSSNDESTSDLDSVG